MGNANGKEESSPGGGGGGGGGGAGGRGDGDGQGPAIVSSVTSETSNAISSDSMGNTPPDSPGKFRSPILFAPQVTISFNLSPLCVLCLYLSVLLFLFVRGI